MHHFRTTIVLALATLLSVSICSAQQAATTAFPNLIRYSGTLKDAQGAALPSTAAGVTFAIYRQQDGGAPVWMETQNVTPDPSGQYSVVLGSTTTTGLPDDLFSQQEQRWLGVQVQGQPEQARVLLVSVPYAFKAHEAETLGGLPASAFVKAPPSDTSNGTSVSALSTVGNASSSGNPGPLNTTNGYIPYFVTPIGYQDSIMSEPGPTLINVNNGNFNLTSTARAYQIGSNNVLSIAGTGNVFVGVDAGPISPAGLAANTFVGDHAGFNSTGAGSNSNTFVGANAGYNSTASSNSFFGVLAGSNTTTGNKNTISGYQAGRSNTTGTDNAFYGYYAGYNYFGPATTGSNNTYLGRGAGASAGNMTTGSNNTFVGSNAGNTENGNVSNNIEIGNTGSSNLAGSNQILIGTTQTGTHIAGIYGGTAGTTNRDVCVDSSGKLWGTTGTCNTSSRRFKEQIADMGDTSSKLFQLRPVSFFYKPQYDDGSRLQQYGLIAEEVAKVYPEMAVYDKDGQPYSVKYQLLAPMMLNELQKQHKLVAAQQSELQTQLQQISAQRQEIDGLKLQLQQQNASLQERLSKVESYVATQMKVASDDPPRTTPGANGGLQ